jgi:hypothetical protein
MIVAGFWRGFEAPRGPYVRRLWSIDGILFTLQDYDLHPGIPVDYFSSKNALGMPELTG